MNEFERIMRRVMYPAHEVKRAVVDGAAKSKRFLLLDSTGEPVLDDAGTYEYMSQRMDAASIIQAWAEDDDLDPDETSAGRLLAMLVGVADDGQDGDLDEDEQDVLDSMREAAWDYLAMLGIAESDIAALLDDWDEAAGERVRDAIAAALPDDDESAGSIDSFVFGESGEQDSLFDATYKKRTVVRGGKKMRIKKRVSGRVRLSAKQKMAMRKARRKSHSAGAKVKRMRSMRKRKQMGM